MLPDLKSIVVDVQAVIASGDDERRRRMLREITTLFVSAAARLGDDQVAAFEAVILRLAHSFETDARADVSRRLAPLSNAPGAVLRDLASDASAEVAGPVLTRWTRLNESELAQMAEWRGPGHLLAIAQRSCLSQPLTDLLIKRGDQAVLRAVARNACAQISARGFRTLVSRSVADPELVTALGTRSDLSAAHRERLTALGEEQTERFLNEAFGPDVQQALIGA